MHQQFAIWRDATDYLQMFIAARGVQEWCFPKLWASAPCLSKISRCAPWPSEGRGAGGRCVRKTSAAMTIWPAFWDIAFGRVSPRELHFNPRQAIRT